jgi:hypothetical protein
LWVRPPPRSPMPRPRSSRGVCFSLILRHRTGRENIPNVQACEEHDLQLSFTVYFLKYVQRRQFSYFKIYFLFASNIINIKHYYMGYKEIVF